MQATNEDIVLNIDKEEIFKISCYMSDSLCVLFISVTKICCEYVENLVKTQSRRSLSIPFEDDNQIIIRLNSMFNVATSAIESLCSSKITDIDETEYIDTVDRLYEKRYVKWSIA